MENMRMLGLALGAWIAGAGCASDKDGLRSMAQESLAQAVAAAEGPTLARMQQGAPALSGTNLPAPRSPAAVPPTSPTAGALVLAQASAPAQPASFRPTPPGGDGMRLSVRARVNGEPIFDRDVLVAVNSIHPKDRNTPDKFAKAFQAVLQTLVNHEVVYQSAVSMLRANNPKALEKLKEAAAKEFEKEMRKNMESRKWTEQQVIEQLQREGLTLEGFQRLKEKEFIRRQFLNSRIQPVFQNLLTPAAIREYYDQHPGEFQQKDRVKWQNLFIAVGSRHKTVAEAWAFAASLIQRWQAGEDFNALLAFNDGPNRTGEGYGSQRGEIQPPELEAHLFALQKGEIGPPVQFPAGVHIFRVIERDYAGLLPFDEEVQKLIRKKLSQEIYMREERRILQELRARTVIEIMP